jgi:hypothetical protein
MNQAIQLEIMSLKVEVMEKERRSSANRPQPGPPHAQEQSAGSQQPAWEGAGSQMDSFEACMAAFERAKNVAAATLTEELGECEAALKEHIQGQMQSWAQSNEWGP